MVTKDMNIKIWGIIGILVIAAWLLGPVTDAMAFKGEELVYKANGVVLKGYLAYDDAVAEKRPGVLVVHEWWGINEFVRDRARELAKLGYTALAVDMYGEGKEATNPNEAGKLSGELRKNASMMKARFDAAGGVLSKHLSVDSKRIAAIGYSSGGYVVLEMARQGSELAGVVVFWGTLKTESPAQKGMVKAKVLVLNGMEDPWVPAEQVKQFKAEMDAAGVNYKVIDYPKAKHAFSRPQADIQAKQFNLPQLAYNAEADRKSWAEMETFFNMLFRK
jgi:dienelactone hydrolase